MQQFENFTVCGIIGSLKMNHASKMFSALIYVNKEDRYGYHKQNKKYYVSFFDTAYTSLFPYISVGDTIVINQSTLDIDYETKKVFIGVRESAHVFLIHKENRSNLLARQGAAQVDPQVMQEFDICNPTNKSQ